MKFVVPEEALDAARVADDTADIDVSAPPPSKFGSAIGALRVRLWTWICKPVRALEGESESDWYDRQI